MRIFWRLLSFFAVLVVPVVASSPQQQIHVLLDFEDRAEFSNHVEKGLRLALQAEGSASDWPSSITTLESADNIHTVTSYGFTVGSNSFTVIVSHIPHATNVENHRAFFKAAANDPNVLSALCVTSDACQESREADDLLVISPTATSSALLTTSEYQGLVLISPTNALQAKAIYKYMKESEIKDFVVIYEPGVYGSDFYSSLHAEYVSEYYREPDSPAFLAALPLYDMVFSEPSYKALTAAQIMDCIDQLVADELLFPLSKGAVVYMGEQEGFGELVDAPSAESYRWLVGDAVYVDNPMAELKIKYTASGNDIDNSERISSLYSFMMGHSTEDDFVHNQNALYDKYKRLYPEVEVSNDVDLYTQYGYDSGLFLMQALQVALSFGNLNQAGLKAEGMLLDLKVNHTHYPVVTSNKGRNFTEDGWFQVFELNKASNNWHEKGADIFIESAQNSAVRVEQ